MGEDLPMRSYDDEAGAIVHWSSSTVGVRITLLPDALLPPISEFSMFSRLLPAVLLAILISLPLQATEPAVFPLKDDDVWVMAGDSITAQHLYSNYFEAFCYARYRS